MTDIVENLRQIEDALSRLKRERMLQSLNPGLHRSEVAERLLAAGFNPSTQLEDLYSWHDGTRTVEVTLDDIQIFPGFYLLSLDDAVSNYFAFAGDARWRRGWLPLFANGGGDFYVIDLAVASKGEIRHFRIEELEHPVEFSSLADMAATLVAAFAQDVFFVDPDGYLEMDDQRFASLAEALNPTVAWWK